MRDVNRQNGLFPSSTPAALWPLAVVGGAYVKELVLRNFAGLPPAPSAERMIELSLYVEEKLKSS